MELPLYSSFFSQDDRRPAGRVGSSSPTSATMIDLLGAAARRAARRSVLRTGDPVGPRRRRVLPRDLRAPRRGPPPAQRRRRRRRSRKSVGQAGAAGVPERRLRSDAAKLRGTTELMGYYQFDDEGVKARPVTGRRPRASSRRSCSVARRCAVSAVERPRPGAARLRARLAPVEPDRRGRARACRTNGCVEMLKEEARRQGKPFGLLFDNIEGGFTVHRPHRRRTPST